MALAAVAAGCSTSNPTAAVPKVEAGSTVGPSALGVNVAAWDSIYGDVDVTSINGLLQAAGVRLMRYSGGSWADEYDWSSNTDTSKCAGTVTTACEASDPLGFDEFSAHARSAGASTFITVNYGSGTPSQAAAWITHASATKADAVALWEVGNETYSCYETNHHLAGNPTFVKGYLPGGSVCPSTAVMARSYAVNVLPYLAAMKKASPSAKIGVPWAFSSNQAQGAGVDDAALWNAKVLHAVKGDVSFVDAHWYPFDTVSGLTVQEILQSTERIPAAAAKIRTTLHRELPGAAFVVGETNISERPTVFDFEPVSALFAAATSLTWLAQGAESVDWWDLNNFGSPANGDYGMVSSGSPETEAAGAPLPPYYGEQLASMLTASGSHVEAVDTGSPTMLGFESDLGQVRHVLLVNTGSTEAAVASDRWFASGTQLRQTAYSAATAGSTNPLVRSAVVAGRSEGLAGESIVVLSGNARA